MDVLRLPQAPAERVNETDAIVVGAGPNGLAAAIYLARAGVRVLVLEASDTPGGAARSAQVTLPGFVHDLGSAIHPMAAGSPFFRELGLERHGLEWVQPEIALAHPLDGGTAAMHRSLEATAKQLRGDGPAYRRLMQPLVKNWEAVAAEILRPMLHLPRHPVALARFGLRGFFPAMSIIRGRFRGEHARALFAGLAAHSFLPLSAPGSSAIGLALGMMGHAVGWPFPRGGAQAITDALAACLREHGGVLQCNTPVASLADLPPARAILLDVSPWQLLALAGARLPAGYGRALERFRHAPGIFKIDYALDGPVPWRDEACRRAGTIHLGGSAEEIMLCEREIARGRIPDRPFVLAAQHSVFDPTRAPEGRHTFWAYCHLPLGSIFDMTSRIEQQIERFAPGFRERILARHTMGPARLQAWNANLIGGDISGGANSLWQLFCRPVPGSAPYRTPLPGVYLCSASTPPGGGVHGMCGYHAARVAFADVFA
ncbi:MAG TPA: NAD(P)/FAD-dependent oxidoreductase [Chthoniobacteraceae bacterium]|nr:NAD(P)/FAD-dependent oxidoreductase [Chthoniobacteraceae bacterium]